MAEFPLSWEFISTNMWKAKVNLHNRVMSCRWTAQQIIQLCDFLESEASRMETRRVLRGKSPTWN